MPSKRNEIFFTVKMNEHMTPNVHEIVVVTKSDSIFFLRTKGEKYASR